ncbi:MAG: response regulator [Planctomycetes bacterium]|nr:response regulator [Planctomycetota bacterium]
MNRRRVLFIDDDQRILEGIARLLRPKRTQVEVLTAVGGAEALTILAREQIDVVISDMRMPQMDGAQLLAEVRRLRPQIVRIILSGQSDRETILRAVGPAHQFLSKPCDPEILTATVLRSCALRDLLADEGRQRDIAAMSSLPCAPTALAALRSGLLDASLTPDQAAALMVADLGLSAKVLQLTTTSFFGTPRNLMSPHEAAMCLGPDILRSLAEGDAAFPAGTDDAALVAASRTARRRSSVARELASGLSSSLAAAEIAGLLCGCGSLLPAGQPGSEAPGCHGAAFLAGLWGLPDQIVEAILRSACPSRIRGEHDRLAAIVHASAALVDGITLDREFCETQGVSHQLLASTKASAG